MAAAGDVIEGFGGFRLRLVRVEPEVLEMEASYGGATGPPPSHLHPSQDERFEVLEGTMRTVIDGVSRSYDVGGTFAVPAGTPHQVNAEGPARVRWEVRPALRTAEFFERLYGDGPGSAREAEDPADFFAEFSEEFRLT